MKNKYVNFISDEHLLTCIGILHNAYLKAKNNITKKNFYSNKVDTIKLTFDSKFNDIDEEKLIQSEILRQIDKSINNSIGTFHEQILGGIKGFEAGNLSGYDIKATDNMLFADIKNKHNTMNSSAAEALFQKLKRYADEA
ncbi:MAG: Eco47II family restriction endonuclease [Bacteroidales bacterium]|nr:Eco47II family restriction endonuclease [Bacteroidales bacterium]